VERDEYVWQRLIAHTRSSSIEHPHHARVPRYANDFQRLLPAA
jgi:hypothetical protein